MGRPIIAEVCEDEEALARDIDAAYAQSRKTDDDRIPTDLDESENVEELLGELDRDLLTQSGKGPIVRLVDTLLFRALSIGASDIHIQPTTERVLIRYRTDGVLHDVHNLPRRMATEVVSRIKVMGRMDVADRRIAQDGRATVTIGERAVDLRLSILPTTYGERAVIRLLDNSRHLCDFDRLGMPPEIADRFLEQASRAHGIILVTGPTGSGKTTTLYATLRRCATPQQNVMTIEDPVEYELSSAGVAISQAQVNSKKGVTFATGLRHILRQDPDVIMIGEIRDAETARIAIQSSLTGHLVLSTLHTNDAPSAVTRLIDLGVEPYLVSASLSAVLAQRLVRLLHTSCDGRGCSECLDSGFRGRTGLFELLVLEEPIRELITEGASLSRIRAAARRCGLRSLREEGDRLVAAGATTSTEVQRVTQVI